MIENTFQRPVFVRAGSANASAILRQRQSRVSRSETPASSTGGRSGKRATSDRLPPFADSRHLEKNAARSLLVLHLGSAYPASTESHEFRIRRSLVSMTASISKIASPALGAGCFERDGYYAKDHDAQGGCLGRKGRGAGSIQPGRRPRGVLVGAERQVPGGHRLGLRKPNGSITHRTLDNALADRPGLLSSSRRTSSGHTGLISFFAFMSGAFSNNPRSPHRAARRPSDGSSRPQHIDSNAALPDANRHRPATARAILGYGCVLPA